MTQATQTDYNGVLQKRWAVRLDGGTTQITWAPSKAAAARKAGVSVARVEPISGDWRNEPRGGVKTKRIAIRVTEEQWAAIRARAEQSGVGLTEWIVGRCS